jgi:hypothetical protein
VSTGPHLHFQLREKGGLYIDPLPLFQDKFNVQVLPSATNQDAPVRIPAYMPTQSTPNSNTSISSDTSGSADQQKEFQQLADKFGTDVPKFIQLNANQMIQNITKDGFDKLSPNNPLVNKFVAPFPTKTKIELKLAGISGISVSDSFFVDRLPFLFKVFGCFQIVEIVDSIGDDGWFTTLHAYFKFLWPMGRSAASAKTTTPSTAIQPSIFDPVVTPPDATATTLTVPPQAPNETDITGGISSPPNFSTLWKSQ